MRTIEMAVSSGTSGKLLALLSEQCDLCRRLAGLADRQRERITGDEPELLLTILADRQRLIDRLGALTDLLRPYQQNWREVRAGLDARDGREADRMVAEVNELLLAILQLDEADARMLSARKIATARALTEIGHQRMAGTAYAMAGASSPAQVDWTDE